MTNHGYAHESLTQKIRLGASEKNKGVSLEFRKMSFY